MIGTAKVAFAFSAGLATFLAPCAYPLLPGYVAYFLGTDEDARVGLAGRLQRAVFVALATSAGFFAVYAVLAGVATAVGARALQNIAVLELVVGALLVVLGAAMALGRFQPTLHVPLPERRRSTGGYFLFGVVYAAAAAGCTAPVFIGIATTALDGTPTEAITTFVAYAAGMSLLMLAVTVLAAAGQDTVLRRLSRASGRLTRVAGVVLVGAGIVQLYFFLFEFDGLRVLGL
jgi:cytochrome c-type biogenesis protein